VLICGAQEPVDCTAEAVRHVQLHPGDGGRSPELVLCDEHFAELEPEYRRDWHAVGRWCAYPWRKWDHVAGRCVEDDDDDGVRQFTMEEIMWLLENDRSHSPDEP